jgi:hypothetical protein
MPVSVFFQQNSPLNTNEQRLIDSLVSESIHVQGIDVFYIPRLIQNFDKIYGTDTMSLYQDTYLIEMYLKNVEGFLGDQSFMSKFGLEIRDQVIFQVSISNFKNLITPFVSYDRPHEGDLIYFFQNRKCFQIKFVDKFQMYYPLGSLYLYEMKCELFEYSGETFNTRISEIDILQKKFSTNILDYAILTENGQQLKNENGAIITREQFVIQTIDPISDTETLISNGTPLIDLSPEFDPFSLGSLGN